MSLNANFFVQIRNFARMAPSKIRLIKRIFIYLIVSIVLFLTLTNIWVVVSTKNRVLNNVAELPTGRTILVLGTSNRLTSGEKNPFFVNRMDAAWELYKNGKATQFILSGDNRTMYYNEPIAMKKALMAKGVPDSLITLDYAGLRTLDSIVRCKEIFGQDSIIIVTQTFHGYRALFISNHIGLDAFLVEPARIDSQSTLRVRTREVVARSLAVIDLYLLGTSPRHLGKKIELPDRDIR